MAISLRHAVVVVVVVLLHATKASWIACSYCTRIASQVYKEEPLFAKEM